MRVILNKRKLEVEFKQRKKPKIEKEKKPRGLTKEQWSALVPVLFLAASADVEVH